MGGPSRSDRAVPGWSLWGHHTEVSLGVLDVAAIAEEVYAAYL